MFEQIEWKEVYKLWNYGCYRSPEILKTPVTVERVFINYGNDDDYFYGFDWLTNDDAQETKKQIRQSPVAFLYHTRPTNKGTIQTAEMLASAQNEEELAAIWIAANAKELSQPGYRKDVYRYSDMLCTAACDFLQSRFHLWHHSMKKLVPEIMIPRSVLENMICQNVEPIIGLIQTNIMLLKSTHTILQYSSLKRSKHLESRYRIKY